MCGESQERREIDCAKVFFSALNGSCHGEEKCDEC